MENKNGKDLIVEILNAFKVGIDRIDCIEGPSTTLYEIKPKLGVRISKIKNLKDEIAAGLETDNIRIIAPIPGKGSVGIEVPNKERKVLPIEGMLSTPEYRDTDMILPCVFGRTVTNGALMADLAKMPHLLIAGATGQGKSVGLNTILMSLLHKRTPDELKLILVDPKQVEFSLYSKLGKAYLAKDIITGPQNAYSALCDVVSLMEKRYSALCKEGVRNLEEYNAIDGIRKLPYLVVVIDEYGDLVMQSGKEMERVICRIAQKARAVGIHMIISTQRPSVKIVTGDIKANFPVRIAFRMITGTDSRVVLGKKGAEALTGKGDMLFFNGEDTVRAQCAFTSTEFVRQYVDSLGEKYASWDGKPLFRVILPKKSHFLQAAEELVSRPIWAKGLEHVTPELRSYALGICGLDVIPYSDFRNPSRDDLRNYRYQIQLAKLGIIDDDGYLCNSVIFNDTKILIHDKDKINAIFDKLEAAQRLDEEEAMQDALEAAEVR